MLLISSLMLYKILRNDPSHPIPLPPFSRRECSMVFVAFGDMGAVRLDQRGRAMLYRSRPCVWLMGW